MTHQPDTARDLTASPAVWIDGHPLMEAIAAAVWEQCSTEGTSLVVDDPRNIAVAAASALPAPVDRAAAYHEVADRLERKASALTEGMNNMAMFVAKARIAEADILDREARELRRMAAEAPATEEQQHAPGIAVL